jgi:hypothetical protein
MGCGVNVQIEIVVVIIEGRMIVVRMAVAVGLVDWRSVQL